MNGTRGVAMDPTIMLNSNNTQDAGAGAAAVSAPSPWRPLVVRAVIGAVALLGLSGIGASSMLLGLDGAHASPPSSLSAAVPSQSASSVPVRAPSPDVSAHTQAKPISTATATATSERECLAHTDDGRIILNLATSEDLRKLPGIGPKRADAIVALRTKLKRFRRNADLLRVRGIGPKLLARMQSSFVLDPPTGTRCTQAASVTTGELTN